jgi:hypothetical protein
VSERRRVVVTDKVLYAVDAALPQVPTAGRPSSAQFISTDLLEAVTVDEAGDDGGTGGIDDIDVHAWVRCVVRGPDPRDAIVVHQDADPDPQVPPGSIGERGVRVQGAPHLVTVPPEAVAATGA